MLEATTSQKNHNDHYPHVYSFIAGWFLTLLSAKIKQHMRAQLIHFMFHLLVDLIFHHSLTPTYHCMWKESHQNHADQYKELKRSEPNFIQDAISVCRLLLEEQQPAVLLYSLQFKDPRDKNLLFFFIMFNNP